MKKCDALYSGKVKTVYATDNPKILLMEFRDDATAFNGKKHELIPGKGELNNRINTFIMQHLQDHGIKTHFVEQTSATECAVKPLKMVPVECVIRNCAAGSLCRRLPVEEGMSFATPLFEFFYKSDEYNDPLINDSHILTFGWANEQEIKQLKSLTARVNDILKMLFHEAGMLLVDYKLEFGRFDGELLLGDEFTPDGCRLWDIKTGEKLDKDRFRHDLGDLMQGYLEVARRLDV